MKPRPPRRHGRRHRRATSFPGLAVAREMQRARLERELARHHARHGEPPRAAAGIALDAIGFSGLRGKGVLHTLTGGLRLLKAFWDCLRILRRAQRQRRARHGRLRLLPRRADGLAARQAAGAGQRRRVAAAVNRALLPVADRVVFGFDGAGRGEDQAARSSPATRCAPRSRTCRRRPSASPAAAARCGAGRRRQPGRQGAERDACRRRWRCSTRRSGRRWCTRPARADRRACAPRMPRCACRPRCCRSSTTWPARLAACDVIVCRAGAVTVSELCAAGVASVLVPLIVSTTSHQRDNALFMAQHGAALHLPQTELTPESLATLLRGLDRDAAARDGRAGAAAGAAAARARRRRAKCAPTHDSKRRLGGSASA